MHIHIHAHSYTYTYTNISYIHLHTHIHTGLPAQATASQARVLAQGRLTRLTPAEKRKHQRERRMSLGLDATLHFEASIEVFKAQGTTDDLVRPENVRG